MHSRAAYEAMGLADFRRGKSWVTTVPDRKAPCPLDKVNCGFKVQRPNALWVVNFTYVHTWEDFVYVAIVIDAFARRIVDWNAGSSATAGFVLDALEQAIHARRPTEKDALVHHPDGGSQGGFNRSSQRGTFYLCEALVKRLGRCSPSQRFARSAIEGRRRPDQLGTPRPSLLAA